MMYNKGNKFIADFVSRTKKNDEIVKNNDGYEVTQLINSLIGLLIIPEQTMYRQITDDSVDDKLLVKLISCINKNTYKPKKEDLQAITRHMRNAVAHSKISFKSEKGEKDISSVLFRDKDKKNPSYEFCMIVDVDVLKEFVNEFSDSVAKLAIEKTKNNKNKEIRK